MSIPAELADLFARTRYVVEATFFESHSLWNEFRDEHDWVHSSRGGYISVGRFGDMPVGFSCEWWQIDGVWVLFYEPVSTVVDHRMIDTWLRENCKHPRTNADNFHHCLHHIAELNKNATVPQ